MKKVIKLTIEIETAEDSVEVEVSQEIPEVFSEYGNYGENNPPLVTAGTPPQT